jgi:serine phosphatase RsbU (regulator of sigma subunit)
VGRLISVARNGQLATALCAKVDLTRRRISLATAGHLPPLLLGDEEAQYLEGLPGLPLGVDPGATYPTTTVAAPPAGTLVGFTDGLVERRGESLDIGLSRLREAARGTDGDLPDLLGKLVTTRPPGASNDDIAIVALRWNP